MLHGLFFTSTGVVIASTVTAFLVLGWAIAGKNDEVGGFLGAVVSWLVSYLLSQVWRPLPAIVMILLLLGTVFKIGKAIRGVLTGKIPEEARK